jgi:hypothetical protein
VAIKTVLQAAHLVDDGTASEYAQRFEREAQAAARLNAPERGHGVRLRRARGHLLHRDGVRPRARAGQAFDAGERFPLPEAMRIMRELLDGAGLSRTGRASCTATSSRPT